MPDVEIAIVSKGRNMKMPEKKQGGFTYLEVMISIVILTVGITAQLSALSLSMVRARSTEERNTARQVASSTIESVFASRDIGSASGISNWDAINTKDIDPVNGVFEAGWRPIRVDAGKDGLQGTEDDACAGTGACTVGMYSNTSLVLKGFERKVEVSDIIEPGVIRVRKRRITVKIKYFIGQLQTEESLSTIVADLPFYK
jgi:type II secretory pathway pseudopilin PulG